MISKLFIFQFVNSYASLFYLAFIAEYIGDCPDIGCMPALAFNIGTISVVRFLSNHLINNMLIPSWSYARKLKTYTSRMCGSRNHIQSFNMAKIKGWNTHFNSKPTTVPEETRALPAIPPPKKSVVAFDNNGNKTDPPKTTTSGSD
jgi:hypothetical protein